MRKYLLSTALLVCGTLFALPFSQTKECSSLQGWDEISQNWQTNQFGSNFMHSTFFLGTGSFPGTGTGAIPDGPGVPNSCGSNGANLDVSFNVSGLTGAVTEVSIDVTMTHTWIADVTATLIAPDGTTSLVLFGRTGTTTATSCGDSSNLGGTYLFTDDAVSTNWWAAAAAIGDTGVMAAGSYRTTAIGPQTAANFSPETSLNTTFSTLADANGTWILRFTDGGLGDTGAVSAANLHIETEETEEPGGPIEECNNTEFAIADNASISSVINITESGTIGTDANLDAVIMDIQHTFAGDLEIVLISPTGTEVALSTDNGSSTGLDTRAFLKFTDTSTNNVTAWTGGAPLADYKAEGGATAHPVAAGNGPGVNLNDVFAGQSITGNWTLRVYDDAGGDVGTLYSFCLNFTIEGSTGGECEWTVTVSGGCGDEVSWTLVDALGTEVLSGGPYACATYTDTQTITAEGPVEFYIESMGSWGDNTPFYSIANENGVILSGTLAGGTESTFSDMLCSDMPPPAAENDNCGDVTPTELTSGVTATFTGTTVGGTASPEENAILGAGAVWEAVTLTAECSNLTIDFCGTPAGNMDTAFVVYTPDCPATSFVAGAYEFTTCGDGNVTYRFFNLPAGTYYLPVLSDASFNTLGDYTMNVIAEECFVIEEPDFACFQGDGLEGNGENGYGITSINAFRSADDFIVADGESFSLQNVSFSVLSASELSNVNLNIYSDNAGQPGTVLHNIPALTPTEQNLSGSAFGFNIYWVEIDLPAAIDLEAGTYWLAPDATNLTAGNVFWEVTSTGTTGGAIQRSTDTGATWAIDVDGMDAVFFVAGTCEELPNGCFVTGQFDQWPTTTYTPSCSGIVEVITASAWAGEYSKVQVTAGTEYIFSSSVTTDFITIADEDEEIAFTTGTGSVTWTSPIDQVIRFYTHADEDCTIEEVSRTRAVQCGEIPPPPANDDCEDAIALSCGDSDSGSTLGANNSGGNPAGDVFYTFTGSGTTQNVNVSLCGSSYDTVLRVFSDCTLTNEIAFNDDSCGTQSELSFVSDGTSTYIIMVEGYNSNAGAYTINISCNDITDYCEPVLDCTDGDVITNVTFQEINNDSDCSPNGYGNYTDQMANVEAGGTYSMSVTVGAGWTYESVMVWIDFNNNFVFEPSEYYFIGSDPGTTNTADIAIPVGTPEGEYRMRVRVGAVNPDLNDLPTFACDEDTVFGETEDYTVNVGELGVSDLGNSNFAFYPNPVKDFLNIKSKKAVQSIDAFNLAGQKVMSDMKLTQGKLNISNLSPGTYVLRATLEGGQVETFKVIKK